MGAPTRIRVGCGLAHIPGSKGLPPAGDYVDAQSYDDLHRVLAALAPWARAAFDGLEYEAESEREELWERLAGGPDDIPAIAAAERLLAQTSPAPTDALAGERDGVPSRSGTGGDQPDEIKWAPVDGRVHLPALLSAAFGVSRSEARRCLAQGAVKADGHRVDDFDPLAGFLHGRTLTLGKRRAVRVTASPEPPAAPTGGTVAFTGRAGSGEGPPSKPAGDTAAGLPSAQADDGATSPRDAAPAGGEGPSYRHRGCGGAVILEVGTDVENQWDVICRDCGEVPGPYDVEAVG